MTRKTKLTLNIVSSLLYQLVTMICGFILPRLFLSCYGSKVNGLVNSITQFLGFITLAECGVGAVVQSALYKPLANKDIHEVSKIVVSADRFFKRIAYILLGYTAILMIFYPLITQESFNYLFTLILVFVISISSFAQYYLGMTYKLLLNADQLGFIQYSIHAVTLVLNTVSCVLLMKSGASIQIVKLVTSLIFLLQPVLLAIIAKRKYKLERNVVVDQEPIEQKWNGLAHHISGVILGNTDIVVLTFFSTLENVSIYAVYNLVENGVKQIIVSMTNGLRALFGNMLAKNEMEALKNTFDSVEWLLHMLVTIIFSITATLIIPFVEVYTVNITDASYIVPIFAYLISLAEASYCLRLPYYILVTAAGHYKQTQWSAVIEAGINIVVSVVLVFHFGLVGVAIGTFAAMAYRTGYLANYLVHHILYRKISHFIKHLLVDACTVVILFTVVHEFPAFFQLERISYAAWIVLAVKVGITAIVVTGITNGILYHAKIKQTAAFLTKRNNKTI